MKITFYGGAREVTGANHLFESNGVKILIDCGMFQGSRAFDEMNRNSFEYNPAEIDALFITHAHVDHVNALEGIRRAWPKIKTFIHKNEVFEGPQEFEEGMEFEIGTLKVETRKTSGHSPGGTTYVVWGLERPIAIVGDALFAGSIGGAAHHYLEALKNNRAKIFSLPEETIVCPGHGPLTTVGEEKAHNPFFPEFKTKIVRG